MRTQTFQLEDSASIDGFSYCRNCKREGEIAEEGYAFNDYGDEEACFVCKHCTGLIFTCDTCDSKPTACDDWCIDCYVQQLIETPSLIDDEMTNPYSRFREAARRAREAV
jgi:hypothetical protein